MMERREFTPVFRPSDERPPAVPSLLEQTLKSFLRLRTLLALGAAFQTLLFATLPSTLALLPVLLLTIHSVVTTLAHLQFPNESPYFESIIPGRTTALIPSWYSTGFTTQGSLNRLVVFHLVVGVNHPLGVLSQAGREVGKAMEGLWEVMNTKGEEFGIVGWSKWDGMDTAEKGGKMMVVAYFRTGEGLERFGACEAHRRAVEVLERVRGESGRGVVSVVHEVFEVAPGRWAVVGVDSEPCLLGGGACRVMDDKGGWVWMRTLARDEGPEKGLMGMLGR
ncbi:hypothetical protein QBC34DRAFT_479320 [Podospora aff. communis PSN243]|uniref:ABM domain-containing protein n=1 Tax=Podospora aff. communis PSN243 TaxID=3040156 RepID=A0AAV9G457_9PEZI|nr:hypothetical protein QBC34DRAFT_479320 [Podospora aff. communis PSN243]